MWRHVVSYWSHFNSTVPLQFFLVFTFTFKNHKLLSEEFILSSMNNVKFMWNVGELLQIICNFDQLYSKKEENPSQICETKSTISEQKEEKQQSHRGTAHIVGKPLRKCKLAEWNYVNIGKKEKNEKDQVKIVLFIQLRSLQHLLKTRKTFQTARGFLPSDLWESSTVKQHQKYKTSRSLKKF